MQSSQQPLTDYLQTRGSPYTDIQESTIPPYLGYTCMQWPIVRFMMDFLMHYQVYRQENRPGFELDLPKVDRS